jgi:hypothetical protein
MANLKRRVLEGMTSELQVAAYLSKFAKLGQVKNK